ncbi:hypothetical protein ACFL0M_15940 [Thermodesulfobacteriota bacterium]
MPIVALAKVFGQSPATISDAAERGKAIAAENNYRLIPKMRKIYNILRSRFGSYNSIIHATSLNISESF